MIDFSEDQVVVSESALSLLTIKVTQLLDAQSDIARYETLLNEAKEKFRVLSEKEVPEAMDEARCAEFTTTDGKKVTVKPVVAGSIPKARYPEALAWLRQHDHDGLIKRNISVAVALPKGNDKIGNKLVAYFRKLKTLQNLGVVPKDEPTVHPQTFGAWARELFAGHNEEHVPTAVKNPDCPFCDEESSKLLGIYVGRKAEVKSKKE